jgi:ribosome-binding protein aMBF1 (putative translation factor)
MDHQDWNTIIINGKGTKDKIAEKREKEKGQSNYVPPPESIKIEAAKNLSQLISQARTTKTKTQKQLATELGIAPSLLSRWETGKETPTNAEIAKIEKTLGIKLPRNKKIKVDEN